jgi:hypothetical protein
MKDPQLRLFAAQAFKSDSDMGRLNTVLEVLPDAELVGALNKRWHRRGRPRRHTARVLLHILVAGVVYRHRFMTNVLAELHRNSDLREAVGLQGAGEVPSEWEMSRFLSRLVKEEKLVEKMFADLVQEIRSFLPDFGKQLAADSTNIYSYSRGKKDSDESSDPEASYGVKKKKHKGEDGKVSERVFAWFGYKLHLLVDSLYELPLAYKMTTAKAYDGHELLPLVDQALKNLMGGGAGQQSAGKIEERVVVEGEGQQIAGEQEEVEIKGEVVEGEGALERFFEDVPLTADKAYDYIENYQGLHERYGIKPVIPLIEQMDKEKEGLSVYDRDRNTRVRNDETGEYAEMIFCGYEKDRETLKYECPCDGKGRCPYFGAQCKKREGKRGVIIRIKLSSNWRYYTAIARGSKKWKREYNRRTSVERVNGRLKQVLEIERSGLRGKAKVGMRCVLGLIVMLAHAVACLRARQAERMRSMKKPAA